MLPFKLQPAFKDYLWGGRKLIEYYGKQTDYAILAESWELSAHPAGISVISGGQFNNMPFSEFISKHPHTLGMKQKSKKEFPILIKLIDASEDLSVQVHPDDSYARRDNQPCGKTEMWVVLEADPGAILYHGLKQSLTRDELLRHINENTLINELNSIHVSAGDVIFVPAGTIHAIGKGLVIAEIQQNSDATYRVYDYNRTGSDGKQRELHIDKALDVINLQPTNTTAPGAGHLITNSEVQAERLARCSCFTVDRIALSGTYRIELSGDTFFSALCVEGHAQLSCCSESLPMKKGDCVFIPADAIECVISGNCTFLLVSV